PRYCAFCVVSPRPPRRTLFPYTTLFRSAQAEAITARLANTVRAAFPQYAPDDFEVLAGYASYDRDGDEAGALVGIARSRLLRKQDRKSTRLNSSHVKISYAVFCLKKKNT